MSGLAVTALILIALIAANLPFLTGRIFFIASPRNADKSLGWRLLEVIVLYLMVGLFARWLEAREGPIYPQKWEFYAITFCLFLVFAYPGFVYRYMWHRQGDREATTNSEEG